MTMIEQGFEKTKERERQVADARRRFEKATMEMAAEDRFGGPDTLWTEIEIMDEASRLVKEARASR
jgi:hypothetical protein